MNKSKFFESKSNLFSFFHVLSNLDFKYKFINLELIDYNLSIHVDILYVYIFIHNHMIYIYIYIYAYTNRFNRLSITINEGIIYYYPFLFLLFRYNINKYFHYITLENNSSSFDSFN